MSFEQRPDGMIKLSIRLIKDSDALTDKKEQESNDDLSGRGIWNENESIKENAEKDWCENEESDDMYKNIQVKKKFPEEANNFTTSNEFRNSVKDEIEQLDCLLEDLLKEVNKPIFSGKYQGKKAGADDSPHMRNRIDSDITSSDYRSRQTFVSCERTSSKSPFSVADNGNLRKPSTLFTDGVTPVNSGYISCGNKSRRPIKLFRIEPQFDPMKVYPQSPRSYVQDSRFREYNPDVWHSVSRGFSNVRAAHDNRMFTLQKMKLKSPSSSRMDLSIPSQNPSLRYFRRGDGYETDSCVPNKRLFNTRNHSFDRYHVDGYETDSVITSSGRFRLSRTLPYHMHTIPETIVVNNQLQPPYCESNKIMRSGYESDSSCLTRLVPIRSMSSSKIPMNDFSERSSEARTYTGGPSNNNIPIHMDISPSTTNEVQVHEAPSQIVDAVYSKTKNRSAVIGKKTIQRPPEDNGSELKKPSPITPPKSQKLETRESSTLTPTSNGTQHAEIPRESPIKNEDTSQEAFADVISYHPPFVKEYTNFWYKPKISREEAIKLLKDKKPGSFIIRDSVGFPGAYGLAMKVLHPPPHVQIKPGSDPANELVRHYLIEPTPKGVRLKGCTNEPVYSTLAALVYQHSLEPIALPCRLIIPDSDPVETAADPASSSKVQAQKVSPRSLLDRGAACNVIYLMTLDVETLTGKSACAKAIDYAYSVSSTISPTIVHFKVSSHGITITDISKRLFLRRHYPVESVLYCSADYDKSRSWPEKYSDIKMLSNPKCFAFISKKIISPFDNECHVFAEYDSKQPASAIVNFISKVMLGSAQV